MQRIFTGLLFIFLNFSLTLDTKTIGLIPDFIGYCMILDGFYQVTMEQVGLRGQSKWIRFMAIYSVIPYMIDAVGLTSPNSFISDTLELVSKVGRLYTLYLIVLLVKGLEQRYCRELEGETLKKIWSMLVILNLGCYMLTAVNRLMYEFSIIAGSVMLAVLVMFVLEIGFLISFARAKNGIPELNERL